MQDILCPMCNEAHSNEYPRHPVEVQRHAKAVMKMNKLKGVAIRKEREAIRREASKQWMNNHIKFIVG